MRHFAFIPILAILVSGCATLPSPDPTPIHVMTFNLRLDVASDGVNAWPHRKDAVAALVRRSDADLLGVQEALPNQLADLDALLPEMDRFGVGRNAALDGEASAIFYRADRFEVLTEATFWLSESSGVAGSVGWDAALPRIVTWGKLRDRASGVVLYHFNTHFDHLGQLARRESAKLIVAKIDEIAGDSPVILTGDFNVVPDSEPYRIVTSALRDARAISQSPPSGPDSTWNAFRAIEPGRRIDFIFVRGSIAVLDHAALDETIGEGRFPSDHLPVVAGIEIR